MRFLWVLSALLLQGLAGSDRPPASASIEGTILDGALKPVAGADVSAFWDPSPPQYSPGDLPRAYSDDSGRFVISGLTPGGYRLSVSAPGFVSQTYGAKQNGSTTGATIFKLSSGENVRDITVRLTKSSVINGRVLSNTGELLTGIDVYALRTFYDSVGRKMVVSGAGGVQTNDRGEYRITGLGPGRYFVRAESSSSSLTAVVREQLGRPPVSSGSFATSYYPGETDISRAEFIDVREAVEVQSINFVLSRQQTYRIRGHVLEVDGTPPKRPNMGVIPITSGYISGTSASVVPYCGNPPGCDNPTGKFELNGIPPGLYWVRAIQPVQVTPEIQQVLRTPGADLSKVPKAKIAIAAIQVRNSDVNDVELRFYPSLPVRGRVRIDDAFPETARDSVMFGLRQSIGSTLGPVHSIKLDATGEFTVANLQPGEYRLEFVSLPSDVFISEARLGSVNALTENVQVAVPSSELLEIKLSAKSGRVGGLIVDADSKPIPKFTVVLAPTASRRPEFYRRAMSDESGRFELTGIAPGDYVAFSWEDTEDFSYFDPEVMKQFESRGIAVHVAASEIRNLQITRTSAMPSK